MILANRTNVLLNDVADMALDAAAGSTTSPVIVGSIEKFLPVSATDAALRAGSYRNGSEVLKLVATQDGLFLKDDDSLLAMEWSGAEAFVVRGEDGAVALRLEIVDRGDSRYLFLMGRSFRLGVG